MSALRILVIVHQFLPGDSAGTEVYTWKLAKALKRRGHQLWIYHTARDPKRAEYDLRRGTFDGLPVFEVVHNHAFPDFRSVYKDERMEAHLRTVLDEVRPDVVHIQHLHLHSIGYIEILKERGLPVVFTLAEYLLMCLRSWLVKPDFSLCEGPQEEECARCASHVSPPVNAGRRAIGPRPRYSLRRFMRKIARRLRPPTYAPAVRQRWAEVRDALGQVDLFIAPSRFLRERFIQSGMIGAERIVHSDYGFDHGPFEKSAPREDPEGSLRVGFIGSIAEQKGVHLLVQAFEGMEGEDMECRIYGDMHAFPGYSSFLSPGSNGGVRFMGPVDNDRVAEALAGIDVLAVPSLWYENSPLTIHEAFMAGVPVVTGDQGGMAELVEHERSGLHFRVGDAAALRTQLLRLLREPGLLRRLRAGLPKVKDIGVDAEDMEGRFEALLARL